MIGKVIDARYELLERTGEDAFFAIFKARDRVINRTVSIKLLFPRYTGNASFTARLKNELKAATALNHPAIQHQYEVGETDDLFYLVTEYQDGATLKETTRRSAPLPVEDAIDITTRIAEALDYAHRAGYVHGDLTANQILLTPDNEVKITDFGVSRAASASTLAQSNVMLRGVHYLAPEVAQGQEASASSDTYALGIILFEMLTGSLPYNGDTPLAVALKHAQQPTPKLRTINPNVPRAIEGIVAKAMAKDPADRYSSALAMLRDLRRVSECIRSGRSLTWSPQDKYVAPVEELGDSTTRGKESKRDPMRTVSLTLTGIVMLLILFFGVFFFTGLGIPKDVEVPNLIGKSRSEAQQILEDAGLKMKIVDEQFNDKYQADQIIYTIPEAGRSIKSGREVRVTISRGPEQVTVPNLEHATLSQARKMLEDAGLKLGKTQRKYDENIQRGEVSAQEPGPNTQISKGSEVSITISRGPEPSSTEDVFSSSNENMSSSSASSSSRPTRASSPQQYDISVSVPESGDGPQTVRIAVVENGQETEAYQSDHQSGDKFTTTVQATPPATIRVYINDQLIREETVSNSE